MTALPAIRVGQGVDLHPLVPGRPLWLAGVQVPSDRGLAGHSDGDVLAHAVCDALLGAAGLDDLGRHFPASDQRWAGVPGMVLCKEVARMVQQAGWAVVNVDATVLCQEPRLAPHLPRMRARLAQALAVTEAQIRLAPKSPEGLGFPGRGDGIAALAVCLLAAAEPGS